ncbi:hypothetical protein TBR22_A45660 [Luteitalea sp. TBR-22]|uniref:hypothetical protein n=1 Tax=Luteitalea sp. TBR-22 TaxID=2802971 RepID=UPI001AF6AA6D|nr:hypothetical protein [Luteitalea sp. TBR-22]BCS35339.1 hypothetical protein TBR22_A45660 [Luteitalea sp. TBR-22]
MTSGHLAIAAWLASAWVVGGAASLQPVATGCADPGAVLEVVAGSARDASALMLARCTRLDIEAGRWRAADTRLAASRRAAALLAGPARAAWLGEVARLEALRRVDAADWPALVQLRLPDEEGLAWLGPLVRGVAAARTSWARQDGALQARARAELRQLEALARQSGPVSEAERARLVVQGAMAGAQYERDEMQMLLDAAHDLEQRLYTPDDPRTPVLLAWEVEADLLRITDRYAAASDRYRDLLVEWPRRVQARVGLAAAYRRLGYTAQADETLAQARALWAEADPEAQALVKAP